MKVADRLEAKKNALVTGPSKTQDWLDADPKHKKFMDEAVEWYFSSGKDNRFGPRSLAELIRQEIPSFPSGWQHLKFWLERTHGRS